MTIDDHSSNGVLKISGTMDIDTANGLREVLLEALLKQGEVVLDLNAVDAIDTAAFQVILASQANARILGKVVRVIAASLSVTETAAALGLSAGVFSAISESGKLAK